MYDGYGQYGAGGYHNRPSGGVGGYYNRPSGAGGYHHGHMGGLGGGHGHNRPFGGGAFGHNNGHMGIWNGQGFYSNGHGTGGLYNQHQNSLNGNFHNVFSGSGTQVQPMFKPRPIVPIVPTFNGFVKTNNSNVTVSTKNETDH